MSRWQNEDEDFEDEEVDFELRRRRPQDIKKKLKAIEQRFLSEARKDKFLATSKFKVKALTSTSIEVYPKRISLENSGAIWDAIFDLADHMNLDIVIHDQEV